MLTHIANLTLAASAVYLYNRKKDFESQTEKLQHDISADARMTQYWVDKEYEHKARTRSIKRKYN